MRLKYEDLDQSARYALMSQTVVPRPIAWIVTEDNGVINLAPFSYFTPLSSNPPVFMVSIGHKRNGHPKDTLANIRKNKVCTICMVKYDHMSKMHFTSKMLDHSVSESKVFNIPTERVLDAFPPMVEGTPSAFFCTLYQEIELLGSKTVPLIVKVESQYLDEECIKDPENFTLKCDLLASTGKKYARIGIDMEPPSIP